MSANRIHLLGVEVDPLSIEELNQTLATIIESGTKKIIASRNLHSIYLYHHDDKMRSFSEKADYMRIDGMPIIFFAKILGYPLKRKHRVTYVDWIKPLISEASSKEWKVFYLGSRPEVAAKGFDILSKEFPELKFQTAHGYFKKNRYGSENLAVLKQIKDFDPDILMVGMGMPRQEEWILDNFNELQARAILTCGACIDYIAGEIPTPPRWIAKLGLEWLARLLNEPNRLWKRYLVEPWFIFELFMKDILSIYILRKS